MSRFSIWFRAGFPTGMWPEQPSPKNHRARIYDQAKSYAVCGARLRRELAMRGGQLQMIQDREK